MMLIDHYRMPSPKRAAITAAWLEDESRCVELILQAPVLDTAHRQQAEKRARDLIISMRAAGQSQAGLDAFLGEYDLSSHEGIVLMCLAEALLRIPDHDTADRLIADKLADADWEKHLGHTSSLLVNAGTWGLMLTGRLVRFYRNPISGVGDFLARLVSRSGEPLIRAALKEAMRILGHQFVMGQTISEALARSQQADNRHERYSFDMLGEAALTQADAERYYQAYVNAIQALAAVPAPPDSPLYQRPGVSIKLSALHPRFEYSQMDRVRGELVPRVIALARMARHAEVSLTLDAEEAERLEPMLEVFEALCGDPELDGWPGLGLAVQAYQKRAVAVLEWLSELAHQRGRRIMVRLVKGAYWDTEIKRAQERGLTGYPVFTRKSATDASYLVCARRLLEQPDAFYPQFATHNAHTVATLMTLADTLGRTHRDDFEFQRLHGMGESLYTGLKQQEGMPTPPCRVYAPVGSHQVLLAYLVRRLLENGANTSFVNRIADGQTAIEQLLADPFRELAALTEIPHPAIPLPADLFGRQRRNSAGINLNDRAELEQLALEMTAFRKHSYQARPLIGGQPAGDGHWRQCRSPGGSLPAAADPLGQVCDAGVDDIERALALAAGAFAEWSQTAASHRAAILEQAADHFEQQRGEFLSLLLREGGRCLPDAVAELREAVDYCRYYAAQARSQFEDAQPLPGPTGESNTLNWAGRGVFVTISPWNFPLAIFTGQVVAALVSGNCVIAKPASPTPLVALRAIELLHQAGVPVNVLHYLPCSAALIERHLLSDTRLAGVAFTGSTATARRINQCLAERPGAIVPLIAETGGINAMIVDSSALLEQVVTDILVSAFNSAGQRCSALRVLFIPDLIAERLLALLRGAMQELCIGDPGRLQSDIGPVIEAQAVVMLQQYCQAMQAEALSLYQAELPAALVEAGGGYFPPTLIEIGSLSQLSKEVFGPVLHVIRYRSGELDDIVDAINRSQFGLTLGIHSRINGRAESLRRRLHVGNVYVNRNMVGAVVGVQPFGGEGLSGTGPKAGGPHYLHRFATERCLSVNTAAIGGNASLLTLTD